MFKALAQFKDDDRGNVAIEYSLIAGIIVLGIVPICVLIGQEVLVMYTEISDAVTNVVSGG